MKGISPHQLHPKYRPDIDGLRAIAVLSVVIFHAFPSRFAGGFIGVDIFLVISGYLITTIIVENLERDRFSIKDFYDRRVRRIFPALIVVMIVSLIFGWFALLDEEYLALSKHVAGGAAFVSNFLLYSESGYFDVAAKNKPMLHLWSLGIEEQFYLLWPPILILAGRLGIRYLLVALTLAVSSFLISLYMTVNSPSAAFYLPISRFWELIAGGILAVAVLRSPIFQGMYANFNSFVGLSLIVIGLIFTKESRAFPGWWALLPVMGTVLLILAGPKAWINRRLLSGGPLVTIGLISYPLYLWHWPIFSMAFIINGGYPTREIRITLIVVSILLAFLTFMTVEKSARKGGPKLSVKLLAVMMFVLIVSLAMPTISELSPRKIFGVVRTAPQITGQPFLAQDPDRQSCRDLSTVMGGRGPRLCTLDINLDAKDSVVIWGDSHAGGWSFALEDIAEQGNFGVHVVTTPGCPPLVGVRQTPNFSDTSTCDSLGYTDSIIEEIAKLQPKIVILAARWDLYFHGFTRNGSIEKTSHFLTMSSAGSADEVSTLEALKYKLPATIDRIASEGIAPLLITNPPVLSGNIGNLRKSVSVTLEQNNKYQKPIYDILRTFNGSYFNAAAVLCSTNPCRLYDDSGRPLYTDDNHLSVAGALYLAPHLAIIIEDLVSRDAHIVQPKSRNITK